MSLEKPCTSAQTRQLVSTDTLETLKKLASTQELCRDLSIGITLPNGVTYNDMGELIGGEFYEQLKKLSTENLCDISNDINDLPDVDILTTQFNSLKSFQLQSDAEEKLRLQVGKITRMILDYNPSILNTVDTVPQVQGVVQMLIYRQYLMEWYLENRM